MENSNDYHISFFKPTTEQALANRNMVLWLVLIWFVAIFGFQVLLRIIEKPTPQPAYNSFINVWDEVENESAKESELQEFGKSVLSVLGKIAIAPDEKEVLQNALSWTLFELSDDSLSTGLKNKITAFEETRSSITNISNPDYIKEKRQLSSVLSPVLGLSDMDVRSRILPLEVKVTDTKNLSEETKGALPGIMEKYLIHNQSVLTDIKLLGFPFHYFYTAILLLVLFVGLCWLYCIKTDQKNKKLNIIE
jgi:putative solute:sodium symporter small subunit